MGQHSSRTILSHFTGSEQTRVYNKDPDHQIMCTLRFMIRHATQLGLIILGVLLLSYSCKPESVQNSQAKPRTSLKQLQSKEGITAEIVTLIVDSCSHVDMLFNDYPVSMSQNEKNSIISDLTYISTDAITEIPGQCKPVGRKVYNGNGEVLIEADLYFSEGCYFMVFIKDEQALFGNKMNEQGIAFYERLLSQIQEN